ncbi:lipoprotein NlpI [Pseudocolwellia sp. AS88]|uniref:lipoprotein NlpI n=1 Tax=Pseudocolwellia TaxID=2848177 RepID=UPI0026EA589D|nr:lipoprotein NlpI [Pseudocolwellia sp. AS88]MDO7084678.1 lipoprotein NlpI [Pseudocolwellia sp. AS88]
MLLKSKLLIISFVLCVQGCTSLNGNKTESSSIGQLIIAEPATVNYKSEIAILRLSDIILRAEITDEQRAQLFYDRGVIYDSVGLRSLARLDFNRALKLKPDLVDAYNFIGIQYTQLQEFNQAYDSFDSAIDLQPDHEYAYLNRGIALYYGGRPILARDDFETFHHGQSDDPYRVLWLYLAEYEINPEQAAKDLLERSSGVADNTWAKSIIDLYLGKLSQGEFIENLTNNITTNKELSDRLCEAYFYLGKYSQLNGQPASAANFFKLALSTNVFEFVEHRYARLELDLMRKDKLETALY